MQEKEIIGRIISLCEARSWSIYRLAKESGIAYSTLCTMLHKANAPSIPTLIKICNGLNITLSEFFDSGNDSVLLTQQQKEHLRQWDQLSGENKVTVKKYVEYLLSEQDV